MKKRIDVIVAYSSLILIFLTPFYYALYFLSRLIKTSPSSITLLIVAIIIDVLLVHRTFKIYYA
ncbi:hypothetical protein LZY01_23900 [Levilactobacillus zymae]|uniref:Uncharacterized protein n=1 Tax=Levilactobacillus zymae TaxID=267363 RepID=A0ABQ0X4A2_9LACO|nr:hypothetical protein LZY01_23900 [Levilactobacillus zymae]